MDNYITVQEASKAVGRSDRTVKRWIASGFIEPSEYVVIRRNGRGKDIRINERFLIRIFGEGDSPRRGSDRAEHRQAMSYLSVALGLTGR